MAAVTLCAAQAALSPAPSPAAASRLRHTLACTRPGPAHRSLQPRAGAPAAALPPGLEAVGGGGSGGVPDLLLFGLQDAVQQKPALYVLELLLTSVAAYAAAVWPDRPRGWAFKELIAAGPSPVAGKGVFALVRIQAGTVLGAYPGRPRSPADMAAKCQVAPGARFFCFRTRDGRLLDPTDALGELSERPAPGLPWLPIDYMLAFINEPPKGAGGCNVTVEDDPSDPAGLLCVAAREILPGEELFMDYGATYDRSHYGRGEQDSGPAGSGVDGRPQEQQRARDVR